MFKDNIKMIDDYFKNITKEELIEDLIKSGMEVETEWVSTNYGEQLKFAVPPSEENINDTVYVDSSYNVNVVDEIRDEIIEFLNSNRDILVDNSFISKVEKIFEKY